MNFIEALLLILAVYAVYRIVFYTSKRISAIFTIARLKKECGAKIRYTRPHIASFFRLTKNPDLTVEIFDTVYIVRFINGISRFKYLHFASPEFFITYSKALFTLSGFFRLRGRYRITENAGYSTTSRRSVKILPKLEIPKEVTDLCENEDKKAVPVLIFSPAPREISYVAEKKTSVKYAYFGDKMFDAMLFSPSSFVTYADRVKRQNEAKLYEKSISRSSETSFR